MIELNPVAIMHIQMGVEDVISSILKYQLSKTLN
jgi:hypothetical protein